MLGSENVRLFFVSIKASMIKVKLDAEMIINLVSNDIGHEIEEKAGFILFTSENHN